MAELKGIEPEIQELAKHLIDGNRKDALNVVRQRLNGSFDNDYQQLTWKGWERAIVRQENSALIFQLLNGLPEQDAKKTYKELKRMKTEVLIRDHTQTDLSQHYLSVWIKLLETYCSLCSK